MDLIQKAKMLVGAFLNVLYINTSHAIGRGDFGACDSEGPVCASTQSCQSPCCLLMEQLDAVNYRIRPNYSTVRLGFSKLLGTLRCDKICIYTYYGYTIKRSEKAVFDDDYAIFFLIFFIKAHVVGTHLNCIDKSMQFK